MVTGIDTGALEMPPVCDPELPMFTGVIVGGAGVAAGVGTGCGTTVGVNAGSRVVLDSTGAALAAHGCSVSEKRAVKASNGLATVWFFIPSISRKSKWSHVTEQNAMGP